MLHSLLKNIYTGVFSAALFPQVSSEIVWKDRVQSKENHVETTMAEATRYHSV